MIRYENQTMQARVLPVEGEYLVTRYYLRETAPAEITVGMGENWGPLACKEVYGKAVKCALELKYESCVFDLTPAAGLGREGVYISEPAEFSG